MKQHSRRISFLIAASLCVVGLVQAKKFSNQTSDMLDIDKNDISFSQPIYDVDSIGIGRSHQTSTSKSFYFETSGVELRKGVRFVTQGKGAVVRLTPMMTTDSNQQKMTVSSVIQLELLQVASPLGEFKGSDHTMSLKADHQQMNAAHPDLFKTTSAFKLNPQLGGGEFTLKSAQTFKSGERFMVHVFDKNSSVSLKASSSKTALGQNDTLRVIADLSGSVLSKRNHFAELISPSGKRFEVNSQLKNGKLTLVKKINFDVTRRPGELWKLVITAESTQRHPIKRTVEMAFDLHKKSASIKNIDSSGQQLSILINSVETGKYEVRSWVFATNASGELVPAFIDYQSKWMEPGEYQYLVSMEKAIESGLQAPFVVKQIQLLDQTRLASLAFETKDWQLGSKSKKRVALVKSQ